MDQPVSHTTDLLPRNFCVVPLKFFGDSPRRFPDDLEIPEHGVLGPVILPEEIPGDGLDVAQDPPRGDQDVEEVGVISPHRQARGSRESVSGGCSSRSARPLSAPPGRPPAPEWTPAPSACGPCRTGSNALPARRSPGRRHRFPAGSRPGARSRTTRAPRPASGGRGPRSRGLEEESWLKRSCVYSHSIVAGGLLVTS